MKQRPFFSLVMPAYNCDKTVGKTIKSILHQTFADFEFIIVNDGSTDRTEAVLQSFAGEDNRISVVTIPNGGPGNARNVGIEKASGQYLYLIDAGDTVKANTLETFGQYLQKEPVDLLVSSYEMDVLDGMEVVDTRIVKAPNMKMETHEEFLEAVYPLMNLQLMYIVWNKVFRLDIIKEHQIQFPPYKSCEDRLFNIAYFRHVQTCKVIEDAFYEYAFDGKNSLTNKFLPNKFNTFLEFYKELLLLTEKHKEGSSALFLKGVLSCIIPIHGKGCPLTFNEKMQYTKDIVTHPVVQQAAEISVTDTRMRQIMKRLIQTKSASANYAATRVMYRVSMLSPKMIEKMKGNF